MTKNKRPSPPPHLASATAKWFTDVLEGFELESHHVRLLTLACEAWDRCQEARAEIHKFGLTYTDASGFPRTRPEIAIERDARLAFARLVRELDLDLPPPEAPRAPALRSNRRA